MRLRAVLLVALAAAVVAGCHSHDPGGAPGTTSTTTLPPVPPRRAVAQDALLAPADAPAGWTVTTAAVDDVSSVCPTIQRARDRAARTTEGRSVGAAVRLSVPVGLPSLREQVTLFATETAASVAYRERASLESAVCAARIIGRQIETNPHVVIDDVRLHPVRPGDLGDAARSWVASTRATRAGVTLAVRIERVTFRVDRMVVTVSIASSPTFPLVPDARSALLQRALDKAVHALAR